MRWNETPRFLKDQKHLPNSQGQIVDTSHQAVNETTLKKKIKKYKKAAIEQGFDPEKAEAFAYKRVTGEDPRLSRKFKLNQKRGKKKKDHIPAGLRQDVLQRDNFTCRHCGRSAPEFVMHIDHITPESKGGPTELDNLQVLCEDCNMGKGNRYDN